MLRLELRAPPPSLLRRPRFAVLRVLRCAWLLAALGACSGPRHQAPPQSAELSIEPTEQPAPASETEATSETLPTVAGTAESEVERTSQSADSASTLSARDLVKQRAIEHIERDELAAARALLEDLLTAPAIARARALLHNQRPQEALAVIEAVLDDAPGEPRALLLHAEASLRTGVLTRRSEDLERALDSYLRAGASAQARLGASRAARALGRYEDAAALAHEGWQTLGADAELDAAASDESPERTLAEAQWSWFESLPKPDAGVSDERYAREAHRTQSALTRLIAREPQDTASWLRLARVENALGRADDEVRTLERALEIAPHNERVAERLAQAADARGGWSDLTATMERARAQFPENPVLWRSSARARFEHALADGAPEAVLQLRLADNEFERWGALAPGAREPSVRERAWCRAASGWIELRAGRVDAAVAAFRSVSALAPGALHWSLEERVRPALDGLAEAAVALRSSGAMIEAARIWSELHAQAPEVVEWARQAGQTWRAAAEQALVLSKELKLASDGRIADPTALESLRLRAGVGAKPSHGMTWNLELRRAATDAQERAERWFRTSYLAFVDAAQISPNDLRMLCDAAEVAVYQLKRDLPIVREFLREALRLGELRAKDSAITGVERRVLLEAWGDAHECMGVLLLEHKREPARAKMHFLRSVEIGPDPRPIVVETYLPQCEDAIRRTLLR